MALTSQGVNKKTQNSARHTNVTNCQENSYQTERETQEWQKGNKTHKKQCTKLERSKQSTEHINNSAQGINVTKHPAQHIQNSAQNVNVTKYRTEHIQKSARRADVQNNKRTHLKLCAKP